VITKQKSLLQLTLLYSIGSLSSRLMSFVLVFFTTFYLTTKEVGQLDLILVTMNLAIPLVTFQLSDAALRWLLEDESDINRTKIFSNISILLVISCCLFGFVFSIYNNFFSIGYFSLFLPLVFFQVLNVFFQQFIRGIGQNKEYVIRGFIITFLYVVFSIISLTCLNLKVEGLIIANVLAAFIGSIILFTRVGLYKYFKFHAFSFSFSKTLLKYSIPLIPNYLSWWAISSANRYIILLLLGASANGIFAIAFKLPTILSMFINIFYLAWQEKAIKNYNREDRDKYYSLTFEKFLRCLFTISILILATNKLILHFIVSEQFFSAWHYTPILLASLIFNSMAGFYGTGYLSSKETKGAFASSFYSGVLTVVLSFLTIPLIGLYGASLAICLGYIVLFLIRISQTKKFFNISFPMKTFVHFSFLFLLVALLNLGSVYLQTIGIIIAIVCTVWINFDELKSIVKTIRVRSFNLQRNFSKVID
jgi:O-antigen/teichoic acid export membrane protein